MRPQYNREALTETTEELGDARITTYAEEESWSVDELTWFGTIRSLDRGEDAKDGEIVLVGGRSKGSAMDRWAWTPDPDLDDAGRDSARKHMMGLISGDVLVCVVGVQVRVGGDVIGSASLGMVELEVYGADIDEQIRDVVSGNELRDEAIQDARRTAAERIAQLANFLVS